MYYMFYIIGPKFLLLYKVSTFVKNMIEGCGQKVNVALYQHILN